MIVCEKKGKHWSVTIYNVDGAYSVTTRECYNGKWTGSEYEVDYRQEAWEYATTEAVRLQSRYD